VGVALEETYCNRMLAGKLPNIIRDAQHDRRVADLNGTQAAAIGAYISVPIRRRDGTVYGTLCCLRHTPNFGLDDRDIRFLTALGQVISHELEREHEALSSRRERVERIHRAIRGDGLFTVYQPIFDLRTGRSIGVEALARFEDSRTPPVAWFLEATALELDVELNLAAARAALSEFANLEPRLFMAINISPETLISGRLVDLLRGLPAERLVLEITEHARVGDYIALRDALTMHRQLGVRIAVDDAGAGFASLQHILRLQPELIKLDAALTRDIDADPVRRALAQSLVTFSGEVGAMLIAEGVESEAEIETLRRIGFQYGQGYRLAQPELMQHAAKSRCARPPARRAQTSRNRAD
jgi:EAL domain-containing protein (putative c-di-GMP-specific phosphodiesterase class I)